MMAAAALLALLALSGCAPWPELDEPWTAEPGTSATQQRAATRTPRAPTPTPRAPTPNATYDFDYYVLVLSWSPDYCATSGEDDTQQCSVGKKLGFVLHGLWPQYEKGYPSYCSNENMPADVKAQFPQLYPSTALYDHEWEKHGTCSGLRPEEYLALSKALKDSVAIPSAYRSPAQPFRTTPAGLEDSFVAANSELSTDTLAVDCSGSGRFLQALYVCFTVDGTPQACGAGIVKQTAGSCDSSFLVRNVR
jgi:ribonuclease T2